jgi:hypothetical protein
MTYSETCLLVAALAAWRELVIKRHGAGWRTELAENHKQAVSRC